MRWLKDFGLWLADDRGEEAGREATLEELIDLIKEVKTLRWIFTAAYTSLLLLCITILKTQGVVEKSFSSQICKYIFVVAPILFPWIVLRPRIKKRLRQYKDLGVDEATLLGPLSTVRNVVEANAVLFLWKIVMESTGFFHFLDTLYKFLF